MPRDDRFRNRAHPDCIRTQSSQQMNLSRSFITWTRQRAVNPTSHFYIDRLRFFDHQLLQLRGVNGSHIRKTWSKSLVVWTNQRIHAHQVEMIADHHQRALAQLHVDAARRIREYQRFNTQQTEGAHRKRDFFKRVTFVVMHSPLHRQHRNAIDFPDYESTSVALRSGAHKSG